MTADQHSFEPGSFGETYYNSLRGIPAQELLRMQARWENHLTYTVDDECRRMVKCQAIFKALRDLDAIPA